MPVLGKSLNLKLKFLNLQLRLTTIQRGGLLRCGEFAAGKNDHRKSQCTTDSAQLRSQDTEPTSGIHHP
jgi:hypothetical protein